jgi:hypothetical protein
LADYACSSFGIWLTGTAASCRLDVVAALVIVRRVVAVVVIVVAEVAVGVVVDEVVQMGGV